MEEIKYIFGSLFKLKILKPKSASKYHPWFGLDLGKLSSFPATSAGLQTLRNYILETADKISRHEASQGGWLMVTPHFPRDKDKMTIRCTVPCDCYRHKVRPRGTITRAEAAKIRREDLLSVKPADETRESDFWIPKLHLHQVDDAFCVPEWMVEKSLEEFRAHSKGEWRFVHRFPAVRTVWPRDMKDAWIKAHLDQLPMEEELLQAVKAREEKQAQQEAEFKRAAVEAEIARAAELQRKEEAARKELAAKIKKWEKEGRECQKGVSIQFEEWELVSYKWGWVPKTLHGADLYFTSTKVDIIHDGACFRKSRRDIKIILSPIEEVRKTSEQLAPYGLKADGTPRKVAPGPGRPRKFTEEEARHRDAAARALWKELNREKMEEYRRRYREKKKGVEVIKTDDL